MNIDNETGKEEKEEGVNEFTLIDLEIWTHWSGKMARKIDRCQTE